MLINENIFMPKTFELYLLNERLETIYIIDSWFSFIWRYNFSSMGIFEIFLPSSTELSTALNEAVYIYKTDNEDGAYIETIDTKVNSSKGDTTLISGYLLEGIMYKYFLSQSGEYIISGTNKTGKVNAPNSLSRAIYQTFTEFGVNVTVNAPVDFYFHIVETELNKSGYPNLGNLVYSISPNSGYTPITKFDLVNKAIVFTFRKERNRTLTSSDPIIVSSSMDSLYNIRYYYTEASCFNVIYIYAVYPSSLDGDWEYFVTPPAGGYNFLFNPENITGIKVNYKVVPMEIITKREYYPVGDSMVQKTVPDNQATMAFFEKVALEQYSPFSESFGGDMIEEQVYKQNLKCGDVVLLRDDERGEEYNVRIESEIINLSTARILHNYDLGTPVKNVKSEVASMGRRVI